MRRRVVMAHGWVTGGAASESERDITVGGVGQVPADIFSSLSYVALGHLHGQQTLAGHLRYSGSPLPYSFSEATHRKGSWLVELDANGTKRVERVPAPTYRKLSLLRGRLADLLSSPAYTQFQQDFVSVTLTDPSRPRVRWTRCGPGSRTSSCSPSSPKRRARRLLLPGRVAGGDDQAIAAEFVQHVRNAPATDGERRLLTDAFEAVRTRKEAG